MPAIHSSYKLSLHVGKGINSFQLFSGSFIKATQYVNLTRTLVKGNNCLFIGLIMICRLK